MLASLGLHAVVQPAFDYFADVLHETDPAGLAAMDSATALDLVVFTSPRAVEHGLPQLPREALLGSRVLAIGPSTAAALGAAGIRLWDLESGGYTSESLLERLDQVREQDAKQQVAPSAARRAAQPRAFIVAAPGGRQALAEGLRERGWEPRLLMVYHSGPAVLDQEELAQLEDASAVLSVWTSGNAMDALFRRLPELAWRQLCRGEWLVISERLQQLAQAYGPARVHLAAGPGNGAILAAIRSLL